MSTSYKSRRLKDVDLARGLRRRDLFKGGGVLLATLAGMPLLSSCSEGADQPADDPDSPGEGTGDTSLAISTEEVETLDPAFLTNAASDAIMLCVGENLITFASESTEPINELAAEIVSSDDGLTHEFTLKEGSQFHGGYGEVTAEDVKFSFERVAGIVDPELNSTYEGDWAELEEVEVTGTYTGVIKLKNTFPPLFTTTLPGNAGIIISKKAFEELGDEFASQPIGSGPYELVEWERGQRTVLKKFSDWENPAPDSINDPQWAEIEFKVIPDVNAAAIAVETGDVDFGLIPHSSVERFRNDDNFEVTTQSTLDYGFIGFNVTDPKLSDVKVRRALREALDVDSMLIAAFDGEVDRAYALVSPETPIGYWEDAPKHQPDPETAQQLLSEAGVENLELEFGIRGDAGSEEIAQIAQENLAAIGVQLDIQMYPGDQLHQQVEQLQMFYQSFSNQADPSWATVWFTSDQVGDWNFMSWSNDEFDALHSEALNEPDPDLRDEMYIKMQQLMEDDAVAQWVMYRSLQYAHRKELAPALVTQRMGKFRASAFAS